MAGEVVPVPTFYQCKEFVGTNRSVQRNLKRERINFSERSRAGLESVMGYFSEMSFERAGVIFGEYAVINELFLVRRDGICFKAGMAWEDPFASRATDEYCASELFLSLKQQALTEWDRLPLVDGPAMLSGTYDHNYFHWTLETIPKIRFFGGSKDRLVVPVRLMQRLFQRDLLSRAVGGKTVLALHPAPVRLRDPMVAHDNLSEDGIRWLRKAANVKVEKGSRRIYLRRSTRGSRSHPGGGIRETPEFGAFLEKYKFEVVDFADRELGVEQQAKMLDRAAIILAPHGAALTNLVYLNPPLSVIEVIGARTPRAVFMHIASELGFDHHGIFCDAYDEDQNLMVGVEELEEAMDKCLG